MRLFKRGKYWIADLRSAGQGRRSTGQTSKKAAEDVVVRYLAESGAPDQSRDISLESLITKYLEHSKTNKTLAAHHSDKGTMIRLAEHCGPIKAHEVTPEMLERFKAIYSRKVKPATVNRNLNNVQSLFSRTVEWGYLAVSPMRHIKKMRVPLGLPKFYSKEEVIRILKASPREFRNIWLLFLCTGLRRGEVVGLKWADIRGGKIYIAHPKEGREKVIPISVKLKILLAEMKTDQENVVLCGPSGLTHAFKRYADRAGVGGNLHRLRHTVATFLLAQGEPINRVQKLLGHASLSTTSIYTKALESHVRDSVERLDW